MRYIIRLLFIMLCFQLTANNQSFAYDLADDEALAESTKNDLLIVVGSGLAGAVLGLSTLSFVQEPDEHLNNIMYGAAVGIIVGVVFVAYRQATATQTKVKGYYGRYEPSLKDLTTTQRLSWHNKEQLKLHASAPRPQMGWQFRF